ncbi:SRPBCC domain-containing protein [Actinoplanes sp. NPDC023936]|uniref:SRPBCC family protein n=1 Tax=Actinoplanes sp. NPDC023936 TaxID=3154910 RepID=UPI0033CCB84D
MPVISSTKDVDTLTMTFVAEFEATVEKVWEVWADPRKLERWWGPPTWPATFERYEFEPGGQARYYMTGPDGTKARGWWTITAIEAPHRLEFDDGFADENSEPVDPKDATHGTVTIEAAGGRTRMTTVSTFTSAEQLERMAEMGMEEGMREAQSQIDKLLTA